MLAIMFRKIIASVSIISLCIPLLLFIGCADGQNFDLIGSQTAKASVSGSNSSIFGSGPLPEETSGTVLILAPITESPSTSQTTSLTTLPTTSPSETTTKAETTTTAKTALSTVIVIAPTTTRQSVPETTTKPAMTKPVTTKAETTTTTKTAPNTVIVILPTTTGMGVPETTAKPMTTEAATATTAKPVSVVPVTDNEENEENEENKGNEENNAIESGRSIEIVKAPGEVKRGGKATLAIRGLANTVYSIRVKYSSGYSAAKGLEDRASDSDGNCSWSWRIGAKTAPGEYDITVFDGINSYIIKFKVV